MNIHGHLAEFLVDTTASEPDSRFTQTYNMQAFMRLTSDSVLAILGSSGLYKRDAATHAQGAIRELFQILASARVSSHP
jgi:hypothetical protein